MGEKILIALPERDFDVTEVAIPWRVWTGNGLEVVFATESGRAGEADPLLLKGVIFGQLGAKPDAVAAYHELIQTPSFQRPLTFAQVKPREYRGLHLPGGHAQGMIPYLESEWLRRKVIEFHDSDLTIGAICHGVVVLARTLSPQTQRSILYGHQVTALTKFLERTAFFLTFWKWGRYYRTYPEYVQDEISRALAKKTDFLCGESPFRPFVAESKPFLTARWPVDADLYARRMLARLR